MFYEQNKRRGSPNNIGRFEYYGQEFSNLLYFTMDMLFGGTIYILDQQQSKQII